MNKIMKPFYRFSSWIISLIPIEKFVRNAHKLEQELAALSPGQRQEGVKEFYAKKLSVFFAILFWGTGISLLADVILGEGSQWIVDNRLQRPNYGEGKRETELEAYIEGETEQTLIPVQVNERKLTMEELESLFQRLMNELDSMILNNNESLDEVRSSLSLPSSMENGLVSIEWFSMPADIIDSRGEIMKEPKEGGELVEMRAALKCQEQEAEYTLYVHVYPPVQTEAEAYLAAIQEEVAAADESSAHEPVLVLPSEVEGKSIHWAKEKTSVGLTLIVLCCVIAVVILVRSSQEVKKKVESRKRQLVLDYPELLLKINMLLGAGLTIKAAVTKVALEYKEHRGKEMHYAYEELLCAYYEMQTGVAEASAYERFGRRCQLICYVKLGSILSQNLKKGSKGLIALLETEMLIGMEERKNEARRLGEEAGTKLLIPMMLMLLIVLVILMVPAFLSF